MDPLGLPLENFDEFGRYRDTDQGRPSTRRAGSRWSARKVAWRTLRWRP